MRLVVLGLLTLIGLTLAIPAGKRTGACKRYYRGKCQIGGCQTGQTRKMECDSGDGVCCLGNPTEPKVPSNPRLADVCGRIMPGKRIIGGSVVQPNEVQFATMVSLRLFFDTDIGNNGNTTFCAGSLINEDLVVTTANCVQPFVTEMGKFLLPNVRVVVGEYDSRKTDYDNLGLPEDRVKIKDIKIHPNFSPSGYGNNIALVRLQRKIVYSQQKVPACLPPATHESGCKQVRSDCQMAGLGTRNEGDLRPFPWPTKALIRVFDAATSRAIWRYTGDDIDAEGTMIVEPLTVGVRACTFDWGGIVVCNTGGRWELSGLISYHNCLKSGTTPIMAVDMSKYREWIESCLTSFDECVL